MGSVRKKGDRWYYSIELPPVNGKRKRIERAGGKTKKEALKRLALAEADILQNGYQEESKMLFKELLDIWMKQHVKLNCSINTIKSYSANINIHILPKLGNYKVTDITTRVLQEFVDGVKTEGYSRSTASSLKNIINSSLNYAIFPLEVIKNNPCSYVRMPKFEAPNKKKPLTLDEYYKLLEASKRDHVVNTLLKMMFHTGMRVGEVCALQWDDIDFENKIIHIKHTLIMIDADTCKLTSPKTPTSVRDIYFNNDVEQILKKQRIWQNENKLRLGEFYTISDLIFTRDDGTFIKVKHLGSYINNLRKKTNVDFSLHSLRHTHATMLLEAGVGMKEIQMRLGHSNISTTMDIYAGSTDESKINALETFNSYISKKTSDI